MRARRAGLAALLATFAYFLIIAAGPLLFSSTSPTPVIASARVGGIVGTAYADTATTQCASYSGNKNSCATGFRLQSSAPSGQSAQQACASEPSGQQAGCEYGFQLASNPAAATGVNQNGVSIDPDGSTGINVNQCNASAGSFGWLTCPFFDRITHFISGAAKDLMQQFLAVQPLALSGPLYQTWSAIRILANVLFVVIFLVLIFAHVAQFEIDAYAIKKMIPKIVAAVILVQFSYIICSGLVDVGNILGAGIGSIISSVTGGGSAQAQSLSGVVASLISDLTSVLAITALVALAVVNWALASSVFVILLIAAIGFVVTLAVRYFLIGLLIVASPIAFALWVLPNTEAYFGKWLSTFVKLILMYPIIMVLLSIAGDVGGLLPVATTGGGAVTGATGAVAGTVTTSIGTTIIKVLAAVAAFGAVPMTFRWAGGAMAAASSGVGRLTQAGMRAKWNTSGTQVRRIRAERNRLAAAEKIEQGLKGEDGGYAWLNKVGKNRVFGEKLQGMQGPLTALLAASAPADRSDRQLRMGTLVKEQEKTLATFDAAGNPDNLLNTALWYYRGQQAQQARKSGNLQLADELTLGKLGADGQRHGGQKQFEDALRADGAFNLTDFTKSDIRREALFRRMAEKDYLKLPLIDAVSQTARGVDPKLAREALVDHAAIMRQGADRHSGSEPLVYKRRSDPDHLDEIRRDDVVSTIRGLNASAIKTTFSNRNFEMAAGLNTSDETSRSAAEIFADELDAEAMGRTFARGTFDFMGADKRSAVMKMMLKHRDLFANGTHGGVVRSEVIKQMLSDMGDDATAHSDVRLAMREAVVEAARTAGQDEQQALNEARAWLNNTRGAGGTFDW